MTEAVATHQPCPDCDSSDALTEYDDGHTHCFSCGVTTQPETATGAKTSRKKVKGLIAAGEVRGLISRKIKEETCRRFRYTVGEFNGQTVQIAPFFDSSGNVVAQKLRFANKDFTVRGTLDEAGLFGQQLWAPGGKRLVVTEGEIDALSYSQATNLNWPVVSVPNGAQGARKSIKKALEFVESFDEVVFLFDTDEAGIKAAHECAELIRPGKAKIGTLPLKDPNEMLQEGRVKEMLQAVWNAKLFRPDGIVNGATLWEAISTPVEMGTPYPWAGFNELLYGLRGGEIVTLCAGSGIGKSAVSAEIAFYLAQELGQTVGYVALEENLRRSAQRFVGMALNRPIHLPGHDNVSMTDRQAAFEKTLATERYYLYDHFGSLESDNLLSKLRYMTIGCDVPWLFLDHLSIVVSGLDPDEDERRAIDRTMTRLRSFTEETGVGLIQVSHLKRPDKKGHEDGAMTSLAQLRGSAAIAQLSDIVIGLERNQQADDEDDRNTLVARVLKNRYAGLTGVACELRYDHTTGRLTEEAVRSSRADDFADDEDGDDDF